MLNGVLLVGVPMMALLAAAFYIIRKAQTQSLGDGGYQTEAWNTGMTDRRQSSTIVRQRRNRGDGTSQLPAETLDSGFADEDQCAICFEDINLTKVQLLPCKHNELCMRCVNKLLFSDKKECPFCRAEISYYVEVSTGHRYG